MAKAVRIRIKSGGETHNSLESLLRNFSIQDLIPLMDGRLSRWLEQKGEVELSNEVGQYTEASIKTLLEKDDLTLEFCCKFFVLAKDKEVSSFLMKKKKLSDLISLLADKKEYEKSACEIWRYKLCALSPVDVFERIILHDPQGIFRQISKQSQDNSEHCSIWGWLGICYRKGFGVPVDLNEAKNCFEKVNNPADEHWAKNQIKEIESEIEKQESLKNNAFVDIEAFDITEERMGCGINAVLRLLYKISSVHKEEGHINFEKIDDALRKFSNDAHIDEIVNASRCTCIEPLIRIRLLGFAMESAVKSGNSRWRNEQMKEYFPRAIELASKSKDARAFAYMAWWLAYDCNDYKDKNSAKKFAQAAHGESSSTTEEVFAILKNNRLTTSAFEECNTSNAMNKYSQLFQSISEAYDKEGSINKEWIDSELRKVVWTESQEILFQILETKDFFIRGRAKLLGFIMEKNIVYHTHTRYLATSKLQAFLTLDARLCAYYAYWKWNTEPNNREVWMSYSRQAHMLNSRIVTEVISHLEKNNLSSGMLKSGSKQESLIEKFGF